MKIQQRLKKLEAKARFTQRPDMIDPFELARSGELAASDCRYLICIFRDAGFITEAKELEAAFKCRFEK